MDQSAILTASVPIFLGSVTLSWFMLAKAPKLPRELSRRAETSTIRLRLISAVILRNLRNDLNFALKEHDEGNDPYLTRVDYEVPSQTFRKYRRIMLLEKHARQAPAKVQRRIRIITHIASCLTIISFTTMTLAAFESVIGITPSIIALGACGLVILVGLVLVSIFFVRPYAHVNNSEFRGQEELKSQPAIHYMAEALHVEITTEPRSENWQ